MARVKHTPASRKPGTRNSNSSLSLFTLQNPHSLLYANSQTQEMKRRSKPGTKALREIRHFQKSFNLLIPAAPFIRCVKQITHQYSTEVSRWTPEAVVALQEQLYSTVCFSMKLYSLRYEHNAQKWTSYLTQLKIIWCTCLKMECSVPFTQGVLLL
ncbi:histone H3-like centromeric protein HTR12, partial [Mucuna pruriens]